jgi:hypothetical protein
MIGSGPQTNFLGNSTLQIQQNTNVETSLGIWQNGEASALIGSKPNDKNFYITNNYISTGGLGYANHSITLDYNGNVGIGTTNPQAKLDVGTFINDGKIGIILGRLTEGNSTETGTYLGVKGYGTQLENYDGKSFSIEHYFYGKSNSSINFFRGDSVTSGFITFNTDVNTEKMRINANGNVSIGTTKKDTTNALLTVNGTIHAKEVKVDLDIPADFVFHPTYKLKPLPEVEQYVKTNSHLPEIPSASEVRKNGMNIGEMQNKLLQKIEELTLYVIEQQKQIDQLKLELKK